MYFLLVLVNLCLRWHVPVIKIVWFWATCNDDAKSWTPLLEKVRRSEWHLSVFTCLNLVIMSATQQLVYCILWLKYLIRLVYNVSIVVFASVIEILCNWYEYTIILLCSVGLSISRFHMHTYWHYILLYFNIKLEANVIPVIYHS
jgi:hypothetical protein